MSLLSVENISVRYGQLTALRRVAIESGRTLASAFQNVAGGLMRLRDDTVNEVQMTAASLSTDLSALNELQQRFSSNTV